MENKHILLYRGAESTIRAGVGYLINEPVEICFKEYSFTIADFTVNLVNKDSL